MISLIFGANTGIIMGQIPYTLRFKLGKPNKLKQCLVYLRYYSSAQDLLIPTNVRVPKGDFSPNKAKSPIKKSHPNYISFNTSLDKLLREVDDRIHTAPTPHSIDYLTGNVSSSDRIYDFIDGLEKSLKGKLSISTLKQYGVVKRKIEEFDPTATFQSVSLEWLQRLEEHIRSSGIGSNTVNTNIKKLKSILNRAQDLNLIERKQYDKFKTPAYIQNIPVYLTESEIEAFYKVAVSCASGPIKRAGYYFLLGCYTGLRISDLSSFVYTERVKENVLILRAKKNKSIISLPLYPKLMEILEFCKEHTLSMSDQDMRDHVKVIAKLSGIKQDLKVHSARHSFAMLMLEKGLTIDEVAELLGDSKDVAKVYARIINKQLHRRVLEVMKG